MVWGIDTRPSVASHAMLLLAAHGPNQLLGSSEGFDESPIVDFDEVRQVIHIVSHVPSVPCRSRAWRLNSRRGIR
jgi:hypothetical protein